MGRLRLRPGLAGVPEDVLLVPLAGHTVGHRGVAVHANGDSLLHAGDACFHREEMAARPHCTPGRAPTKR